MAKYTATLLDLGRSLIQSYGQYSSVPAMVEALRNYLFDFEYELYSPGHKEILERKFIRHYMMYEIGFETPALFKMMLELKFMELLPYYNMLYKIQQILEELDLLHDRDMKTDFNGDLTRLEQVKNSMVDIEDGQAERDLSGENETKFTANNATASKSSDADTGTDTKTNNNARVYTPDTQETTTYGKKDTTTNKTQVDTIGQGNGAESDFPQGNVAAAGNAYFTTGNETNTKVQENTDGTITDTASGTDTTARTGRDDTTDSGHENLEYSHNLTKNGSGTETKDETKTDNIGEKEKRESLTAALRDTLNELAGKNIAENKTHEYGLTGNRTVAQIAGEIMEHYVNVDEQLILACRDLFMLVY